MLKIVCCFERDGDEVGSLYIVPFSVIPLYFRCMSLVNEKENGFPTLIPMQYGLGETNFIISDFFFILGVLQK